jgi:hypothetical protein
LEAAGVEFIDENGGCRGVRLRERTLRIPALPTFRSGGTLVDVADRNTHNRRDWPCAFSP